MAISSLWQQCLKCLFFLIWHRRNTTLVVHICKETYNAYVVLFTCAIWHIKLLLLLLPYLTLFICIYIFQISLEFNQRNICYKVFTRNTCGIGIRSNPQYTPNYSSGNTIEVQFCFHTAPVFMFYTITHFCWYVLVFCGNPPVGFLVTLFNLYCSPSYLFLPGKDGTVT